MKRIPIVMCFFVLFTVSIVFGQQQSLEEWEERAFIKLPDEVIDAVGIKPGMIIGEVGAGRGRFTIHLVRRVGTKRKIQPTT